MAMPTTWYNITVERRDGTSDTWSYKSEEARDQKAITLRRMATVFKISTDETDEPTGKPGI